MRRLAVALLLAAGVAAVFAPVVGHDFVNYDDDEYVTANPWVQRGLDAETLRWAWTTGDVANWHPLTWMSHMLDWQRYGPAPRGHHATSLLLHAANTALCFLVFARLTGAPWRSALVAALFGLHPLHVESVAWVSERKDVLSACFWLLGLAAYAAYARAPSRRRMVPVGLALALGLAAKPMLVTFPATLLLLDWWPLGRLRSRHDTWPLVREKLPLLALVAASSLVTLLVQSRGGAVASLERYPLGVRAANAVAAWATYLRKTVWPSDLAVFYPHAGMPPPARLLVAGLALVALTALAVTLRRRRPALLVGWLWYLGTLVPVIGLVQVGAQSLADRFTYVPLIGIFMAIAWALPAGTRLVPALAAAALAACAVGTRAQLAVWRDSVTLFEHAVSVTEANALAHLNLGIALAERGQPARAIGHLEESLRIEPGQPEAEHALGSAWLDRGDTERAVAHFTAALRLAPEYAEALTSYGYALVRLGRPAEAVPVLEHALRVDPELALAANNLGLALARTGDTAGARARFEAALRLDPRQADALSNLGALLVAEGRPADGLAYVERALAVRPELAGAHVNRALALAALGRWDEAREATRRAQELGARPPPALLVRLREEASGRGAP